MIALDWLSQQEGLLYVLEPHDDDFIIVQAYGKLFANDEDQTSFPFIGTTITQLEAIMLAHDWESFDLLKNIRTVFESGIPYRVVHKLAENRSYLSQFSRIRSQNGEMQIVVNAVEVTFLKQVEDALRVEREHLKMILDGVMDMFVICDRQFYVKDLSTKAKTFLLAEELQQLHTIPLTELSILQVYQDELQLIQNKVIEENNLLTMEVLSKRTGRWLEMTVIPFEQEIVFASRDITSRKQEQQALERMSQLDLLGNMAAAIAHEIRNPITTVFGFVQLMAKNPMYQQMQHLPLILSEINRADQIISDFLSLSKSKVVKREPMQINELIRSLQALMESYAFLNHHRLVLELATDLPELLLNDGEIRQLLLNIVRNGFESMDKAGTVTIRTSIGTDEVRLEVQDQGKGMDANELERVMLPLYTTKDTGTGLGLSVCQRIAERHDARLELSSDEKGTKVTIHFQMDSN